MEDMRLSVFPLLSHDFPEMAISVFRSSVTISLPKKSVSAITNRSKHVAGEFGKFEFESLVSLFIYLFILLILFDIVTRYDRGY